MDIIYVDEELIVIDKPSGLATVPEGWNKGAPDLHSQLESVHGRLWVIHRLDKITSGVILFARTADSHRRLSILFEKREIQKEYHALTVGNPPWDQHTAQYPLRSGVGHPKRTVFDPKRGLSAVSHFQILKRFRNAALIAIRPETGRTHQIRAHASLLGYPIAGDLLYGSPTMKNIERPLLHAYSLTIGKPSGGDFQTFKANYPPDLQHMLTIFDG
jgi:RluA family pseudouridine synthase